MVKKQDQIKKTIEEIVICLEKRGITVNRVILFGSYATGCASGDSDIDIAIISPDFDRIGLLRRQEILGEVVFNFKESIEALGYGTKEASNPVPLTFLDEIISKGKIIFSKVA